MKKGREVPVATAPLLLEPRAVLWLIEQRVLLPGITVLARLVAEVRTGEQEPALRLLGAAAPAGVREQLEALLIVREGSRRSPLDRLRTGPTSVSGRGLAGALARVAGGQACRRWPRGDA